MAEVETQTLGGNLAAGLLDMVSQHFTQGGVQQVGGGVVPHRGQPPVTIHSQVHGGCFSKIIQKGFGLPGDNGHVALFGGYRGQDLQW